ncbi:hypothetical protein [Chryseobacterium sp. 5_R23647]|uniref:hypothetical protein n=1 Tax=Chryseobacterium sp. 5_R23647 TaxID=2258964 RepID=UPI000E24F7A7|nr:hypothetical protein [Chryseobacterium sp. 5_R23647]REC40464.1 hypothetical protein DRF69_18390 [Chryseobacterium sp. 5_R23647]
MEIKITVINNDLSENYSVESLKKIFSSTLLEVINDEYRTEFEIQEVTEKKEFVFTKNVKLFFPPGVGEYFTLRKQLYLVVGIEQNISTQGRGIIFVKKSNKVLQTVSILDM